MQIFLESPGPHKFGCIMLALPPDVATTIKALGRRVSTTDLAEDGRETSPHITVFYGADTERHRLSLKTFFQSQSAIPVTLGPLRVFSVKDYDVIYVSLQTTKQLKSLHDTLAMSADRKFVSDFPTYIPHATIAYVQKGLGRKYVKEWGVDVLDGTETILNTVSIARPDGSRFSVKLSMPTMKTTRSTMFESFGKFTAMKEANSALNGFPIVDLATFAASATPQVTAESAKKPMVEAPSEGSELLGAITRPMDPEEMQAFLDRSKRQERTAKDKATMPYVHSSNIVLLDAEKRIFDMEALKKLITARPKIMLVQNEKMQHSDGSSDVYYNLGLPALRGLVVNEKTGEFVIVNTCPGAGSCQIDCYALGGSYVVYKDTSLKLTKMVNYLVNDPKGFAMQLNGEITKFKTKWKKQGEKVNGVGTQVKIRWHDAGDFFSPEYKELFFELAKLHPDVDFYAYSKMAHTVLGDKPDNVMFNFSAGTSAPAQRSQVDSTKHKSSFTVPLSLFKDLFQRKGAGMKRGPDGKALFVEPAQKSQQELKNRIAQHYKVDVNTVLSYDEMMAKPKGGAPKWNVIVAPGEGDTSASRSDVLGTYLLFH